MEQSVTEDLISTRNAVRDKYLDLKRDAISRSMEREASLAPITGPLQELITQGKSQNNFQEEASPIMESTPYIRFEKRTPISKKKTPISSRKKLRFSPSLNSTTSRVQKGPMVFHKVLPGPKKYHSSFILKTPVTDTNTSTIYKKTEGFEPTLLEDIGEEDFGTFLDDSPDIGDYIEDDSVNLSIEPSDEPHNLYPEVESEPQLPPGDVGEYLRWRKENEAGVDYTYGLQGDGEKYTLGNIGLKLTADSIILDEGTTIPATKGLLELLIKKIPDPSIVKKLDYETYKALLVKSDAHKQNYDPKNHISSNKGFKYKEVIRKLFPPKGTVTGQGFTYWDDPNELVERLKLLFASQAAGNNNNRNEIISIIEELTESGYIS